MKSPAMKCCCYTVVGLAASFVTAALLLIAQNRYSHPITTVGPSLVNTTTIFQPCGYVECSLPKSQSHGDYVIAYLGDCTPYMEVTCDHGYSITASAEVSYCISGEWVPPIASKELCAKKCGQPPPTTNADVFYAHNKAIPIGTASFPTGTELMYQCKRGSYAGDVAQRLQYTRCEDGTWWMLGQTLRCTYGEPNSCKDSALICLGVFCGLEGIVLLVVIPLIYFHRIHGIDFEFGKQFPALRKKDSGLPLTSRMTSLSTISSSMTGRPKTDIAVIEDIGDDEYYIYAEVPDTDTDNYIIPIREGGCE